MRKIVFFLSILAGIAAAGPAWAITDAYVLISTTEGKMKAVVESQWGFGNCKALIHSFQPNEIIAHIACNDLASLNKAISDDIPSKEGVAQVIVWSVTVRP